MDGEGILSYHHSSQAGQHWGGSQLAEGSGMVRDLQLWNKDFEVQ